MTRSADSLHAASNASAHGRAATTAGTGDRDVPGAATDPSAAQAHDTDRGIGNDCDPGFGGSPTDRGNDARFDTSETENGSCGRHDSVMAAGHQASSSHGAGGVAAASTTANTAGGSAMAAQAGGAVAGPATPAASRVQGSGLAMTGSSPAYLALAGLLLLSAAGLLLRRRMAAAAA